MVIYTAYTCRIAEVNSWDLVQRKNKGMMPYHTRSHLNTRTKPVHALSSFCISVSLGKVIVCRKPIRKWPCGLPLDKHTLLCVFRVTFNCSHTLTGKHILVWWCWATKLQNYVATNCRIKYFWHQISLSFFVHPNRCQSSLAQTLPPEEAPVDRPYWSNEDPDMPLPFDLFDIISRVESLLWR